MSYIRDIIAISGLAIRVHAAYKGSDGYRHISEDVAELQILIDKVAKHFKSTIISTNDCHHGQKLMEGCQSVLQDLYAIIEKHRRLTQVSPNKGLGLKAVRVGKEDVTTLQERLISNTVLLNGFVRTYVPDTSRILFNADISVLVAIILRSKHGCPLFLVFPAQEFR